MWPGAVFTLRLSATWLTTTYRWIRRTTFIASGAPAERVQPEHQSALLLRRNLFISPQLRNTWERDWFVCIRTLSCSLRCHAVRRANHRRTDQGPHGQGVAAEAPEKEEHRESIIIPETWAWFQVSMPPSSPKKQSPKPKAQNLDTENRFGLGLTAGIGKRGRNL